MHAGLEAVWAVGEIAAGGGAGREGALAARAGIASGVSVVGDLIGEGASAESPASKGISNRCVRGVRDEQGVIRQQG